MLLQALKRFLRDKSGAIFVGVGILPTGRNTVSGAVVDPGDALLLENGDFVLLENGDKLLLEA
ncbi:MAG: hypothetical protein ACPG4X_19850 [Pikeienuella sp.]